VISTVAGMRGHPRTSRRAVVMTMGALHAGHVALLRAGRRSVGEDGELVVTVFVNPLQFGPGEDYERYPRSWEADLAVCAAEGADVVFAPDAADMYRHGRDITIDPGPLGGILEGAFRPGHFAGMLTVVNKLLNLTCPDIAVFGEKDYQQLVLIAKMVEQLNLPVDVVGVPTVREADGLARSSRNAYLGVAERAAAAALPEAIATGLTAAGAGGDAHAVAAAAADSLTRTDLLTVDYVDVRAPDLGPAPAAGRARILIAARAGATRLLDNAAVHLGAE
jgi:pantoate--beta-alanine ligase